MAWDIFNRIRGAFGVRESDRIVNRAMESAATTAATMFQESLESMADLERSLIEPGWELMSEGGAREFSIQSIRDSIRRARMFYIGNPLIRRTIRLMSLYVFGKGITITAEDEQQKAALEAFIARNEGQLGPLALAEQSDSLGTDGNLYYTIFHDVLNGAADVRMMDPIEITEVILHPEDSTVPLFYKRERNRLRFSFLSGISTPEPEVTWYASVQAVDMVADGTFVMDGLKALPSMIGGKPVAERAAIHHVKVGSIAGWKFGLPECFSTMPWAKSYRVFLSAWLQLQGALARFALVLNTPGGQKAFDQIRDQFGTGLTAGSGRETNQPPQTGSMFLGGPNSKLAALKTSGMTTPPSEAREIRMMVATGSGFPEHLFGDPSTSNLATSKTLDRPTELMVQQRQNLFGEALKAVCGYALRTSARSPGGALKEAKVDAKTIQVIVRFPDVLEHDIQATIGALVDATTLKGGSFAGTIDPRTFSRMVLVELGVHDVDKLVDAMYPPDSFQAEDWAAVPPSEVDPSALPDPAVNIPKGTKEALRELRRAIERLNEKAA